MLRRDAYPRQKPTQPNKEFLMPKVWKTPVKNAQLVVENVPEKLEVKQEIFRKLDSLCPPDALLNSNTSSLLMSDICAFVSPERKALTFRWIMTIQSAMIIWK